jgi:hypothetical protein
MSVRKRLVPWLAVVAAFVVIDPSGAARAATKPPPSDSDPVEDTKQVEALLDQRDKKALDQLRTNRQNEILYYRGRKRSEILKALGLNPTPAIGAKPPAATGSAAPQLPLGSCTTGKVAYSIE